MGLCLMLGLCLINLLKQIYNCYCLFTFLAANQRVELVIHTGAHLCDERFLHSFDHVEIWHCVHMRSVGCWGHLFQLFLICFFDPWIKIINNALFLRIPSRISLWMDFLKATHSCESAEEIQTMKNGSDDWWMTTYPKWRFQLQHSSTSWRDPPLGLEISHLW